MSARATNYKEGCFSEEWGKALTEGLSMNQIYIDEMKQRHMERRGNRWGGKM
jgi:hypothetical protein